MTELSRTLTESDIVKSDKSSIYIGNLFTVDSNLSLPSAGRLGSAITWESKNTAVIGNDGKVIRPETGSGNIIVELIATIKKGSVSDTRKFSVTVLEKERIPEIIKVREVSTITVKGAQPKLPGVVITIKDDNTFGAAEVAWDNIEKKSYDSEGEFKVSGTIKGTAIKTAASVKVIPSQYQEVSSDADLPSITAKPFDLQQVAILDNIFAANRDRDYEYLLSLDEDRMLYNFRYAAGLDTKNAQPLDGWDAPECNLRGHTTGHYLSALALSYAGSGSDLFKIKIDYMVAGLDECQKAMAASGKFNPGFLSGYSEEQFDKLEQLTTYPKIWAPYYTLHKIMAGLIDCYQLAGNTSALNICTELGDWVYNRLSKLSKEKLCSMWSLYIAGEFGGMNEVMAKLYTITGNKNYLGAALYFNNDKLFVPMAEDADTLGGIHANQHIPQIVGALQIYQANSDIYYYNIAKNFWDMVVSSHIYNIGGTGSGEMFRDAGKIARYITDKTAETCATYNMLKLTKNLFSYDPDPKYMDYYERAMYNHILASQDQSGPNGGSTYFMPLCPGARKDYDSDGNSCCHGTGMENHVKYQDAIYFRSADDSELYINLYIPSELSWNEKGIKVKQTGSFIDGQNISIGFEGSGKFNVLLRVPFWADNGFKICINGTEQNIKAIPGGYTTLSREWVSGDSITITIPLSFHIEKAPDDPSYINIMYGPLSMVALSDDDNFIEFDDNDENILKSIKKLDSPLAFSINGVKMVPNYMAYDCHYHAYFKKKKHLY